MTAFGAQLVVLAAEGDDPETGIDAAEAGDPVGLEPRAPDDETAGDLAAPGREPESRALPDRGDHAGSEERFASGGAQVFPQRLRGPSEVDDAGPGNVKRGEAGGVGLELLEARRIESAEALQSVGAPPGLQFHEPGEMLRPGRDDDLPARLEGDSLPCAEVRQRVPSLGAERGLQRPGTVVEAGVDDAAVPSGLVGGEAGLRFQEKHRRPERACEGEGRRHPDDPAADHGHVGPERAAHAQSQRLEAKAADSERRQAPTTPGHSHRWNARPGRYDPSVAPR